MNFLTTALLARKFADTDLSNLPSSNPSNGKPWLNNGFMSVGAGYTPANDANVVHKTGTETAYGKKTWVSSDNSEDPIASFYPANLSQGVGITYDGIKGLATGGSINVQSGPAGTLNIQRFVSGGLLSLGNSNGAINVNAPIVGDVDFQNATLGQNNWWRQSVDNSFDLTAGLFLQSLNTSVGFKFRRDGYFSTFGVRLGTNADAITASNNSGRMQVGSNVGLDLYSTYDTVKVKASSLVVRNAADTGRTVNIEPDYNGFEARVSASTGQIELSSIDSNALVTGSNIYLRPRTGGQVFVTDNVSVSLAGAITASGNLVIASPSTSNNDVSQQWSMTNGAGGVQRMHVAHDTGSTRLRLTSPNGLGNTDFVQSNSGGYVMATTGFGIYFSSGSSGFFNQSTGFEAISNGNNFYLRGGSDGVRLFAVGASGQTQDLIQGTDASYNPVFRVGAAGAITANDTLTVTANSTSQTGIAIRARATDDTGYLVFTNNAGNSQRGAMTASETSMQFSAPQYQFYNQAFSVEQLKLTETLATFPGGIIASGNYTATGYGMNAGYFNAGGATQARRVNINDATQAGISLRIADAEKFAIYADASKFAISKVGDPVSALEIDLATKAATFSGDVGIGGVPSYGLHVHSTKTARFDGPMSIVGLMEFSTPGGMQFSSNMQMRHLGTLSILGPDAGNSLSFDTSRNATFGGNVQQGYNGTSVASYRSVMTAAGARKEEVGDGAGTWQTGDRIEYNSGGLRRGFFGATPIARPQITASGVTASDILTALNNLGLVESV